MLCPMRVSYCSVERVFLFSEIERKDQQLTLSGQMNAAVHLKRITETDCVFVNAVLKAGKDQGLQSNASSPLHQPKHTFLLIS